MTVIVLDIPCGTETAKLSRMLCLKLADIEREYQKAMIAMDDASPRLDHSSLIDTSYRCSKNMAGASPDLHLLQDDLCSEEPLSRLKSTVRFANLTPSQIGNGASHIQYVAGPAPL